MARSLALSWTLLVAACDCEYRAHAPGGAGDAVDAAPLADAAPAEDAGLGDDLFVLEEADVELHGLDCPVVEGQRVFIRVTVTGRGCDQLGPVEARFGERAHELAILAWKWRPVIGRICADVNFWEDRWLDLGPLVQGTWRIVDPLSPNDKTFEVGPPSGRACFDPEATAGAGCERDCDCASGRCVAGINGTACEWTCGDAPCGDEPDCLQGRCESEMPEGFRQGLRECLPTYGPCEDDTGCPPAQRCEGDACVFRDVELFTPCTRGRQCAAGWSCVVDDPESEEGVCAVRCFTDRTPCPTNTRCLSFPAIGPSWTCSVPGA